MGRRRWGPNWEALHETGGKPDAEPKGLACPQCGCRHFFVVYTRRATNGRIIRRRECRHCGRRISTTERLTGGGSA